MVWHTGVCWLLPPIRQRRRRGRKGALVLLVLPCLLLMFLGHRRCMVLWPQVCRSGPSDQVSRPAGLHSALQQELGCFSATTARSVLVQVILYCGEQLSAEQYAALALQHFNIYVQPRFQVRTPRACCKSAKL